MYAEPVRTPADDLTTLDVPLHVHVEVMLETIAVISAQLQQMERAEPSAEKRNELLGIGQAVRAMRFEFDPYNEAEVVATARKIDLYAMAMQSAQQHLSG